EHGLKDRTPDFLVKSHKGDGDQHAKEDPDHEDQGVIDGHGIEKNTRAPQDQQDVKVENPVHQNAWHGPAHGQFQVFLKVEDLDEIAHPSGGDVAPKEGSHVDEETIPYRIGLPLHFQQVAPPDALEVH